MAADAARIRELANKLVQATTIHFNCLGSRAQQDEAVAEVEAELARFAAAVERGGWVAVAERLPKIREPYKDGPKCSARVLVTEGLHCYIGVYGESYEKRLLRWSEGSNSGGRKLRVTHWRPLPAPPEAAPQV